MNPGAALILALMLVVLPGPATSTLAAGDADPTAAAAPSTAVEPDPFGLYGADAEAEAEVVEAMQVLESAGLELPPLRIYIHQDTEPCWGFMGLYGQGGDKHRIDVCHVAQPVIRHELAHASEHHNVDDQTREQFMLATDSETWNDWSEGHRERGIERAAYLVVWGLEDHPISRLSANHFSEDLALFELLTGSPSPRIAHWEDEPTPAPRDAAVADAVVAESDFS